jgi:hypothetical protein
MKKYAFQIQIDIDKVIYEQIDYLKISVMSPFIQALSMYFLI